MAMYGITESRSCMSLVQEAAEGGDDVSPEVFVQKLGPLLGASNDESELMQLFAKIGRWLWVSCSSKSALILTSLSAC